MKLLTALVIATALLASAGCVVGPDGKRVTGQGLNGFPIDEKCADFYAQSPQYKGNRAAAYADNCTRGGST